MTTYLVQAASTGQVSPAGPAPWRWPASRVIPDMRDIPIPRGHQPDTSIQLGEQIEWKKWSRSGSSVVLSERALLPVLIELYVCTQPRELADFLSNNTGAASLLIEAYEQIQRHFGPSTVRLETSVDPEGDDEPRLVVRICTDLDPVEALGVLDRFDSAWWLDASFRGGDRICIALEYQ